MSFLEPRDKWAFDYIREFILGLERSCLKASEEEYLLVRPKLRALKTALGWYEELECIDEENKNER